MVGNVDRLQGPLSIVDIRAQCRYRPVSVVFINLELQGLLVLSSKLGNIIPAYPLYTIFFVPYKEPVRRSGGGNQV